jgi:hypothetical protein
MKFSNVSKVFDTIETFDAYSGRYLFKSQPDSFETSNPEGSVARRRVLSVAPGLVMPARRVIRLLNELWIVGAGSSDGMFGRNVRDSYWMRKATDFATIRTPGQAALGTGGFTTYCMREYLKDTIDASTSADYYAQYETHFSITELVTRGGYIVTPTKLFRVRAARDDVAGFLMASTDELGLESLVTATFTSSSYSPATDTNTTTNTAVPALIINRARLYRLETQDDARYLSGDHTLLVAKSSITPEPGWEITVDGRPWRIEQVTTEQDAWSLHIRRR